MNKDNYKKKCPKCGGVMRQDPDGKDWVCMTFQCQHVEPISESEKYLITEKQINALRLELSPSIIDDLRSHPLSDEINKVKEDTIKDVIDIINANCCELEGKRLKITPMLLCQKIDAMRGDKS
jgi:hypothetical protein